MTTPPLRALVIGATGYTGEQVVTQLCASGHPVWAHVRPDSSRLAEWRARFEAMGAQADATAFTPDAMQQRIADLRPDAIFLLLGTTRARAAAAARQGQRADYEAIDYGLTALIIDAAYAASPAPATTPKLIYLSSMGVSPATQNPYLAVRARVEAKLTAGPLPWVSARPSFITGPDRAEQRTGERVGAAIADGLLKVVGLLGAHTTRDRYRSITAQALAAALIRVALDPAQNAIIPADKLR